MPHREDSLADDFAANAATGLVVPGESAVGRLEVDGDVDWFRVTLEAGHLYNFLIEPEGGDGVANTIATLRNATGAIVPDAAMHYGLAGAGPLERMINADGLHFVAVSGYAMPAGTSATIAIDGPATNARLDAPGDVDWFVFATVAGRPRSRRRRRPAGQCRDPAFSPMAT